MTSGSSGARPAPHLSEVPREHRRLAAIMFTDMVGFSALAQRNETLTLELLEEHRRLLRGFFGRHGGREVKTTGDGFLVEFDSALDAVLCAVQMQESLAERNRLSIPERRVSIRVGIHLGDVIHRENDVFGDGVNIAARIEPLAEGGGVCISEDVYRQIRNKLDVPVTKLGRGELKNIQLPVEVYRVGMRGQKAGNPLVARARFLLRKKRTWAAFALLLLVGLGAFGMREGLFSRADPELDGPLAVAVADFANETGEKDLDGLSGMLITSLEQSRKLSVMTRVRMMDVLEQLGRKGVDRIDEVLGRELCQHARANALVLGTVRRFGELYTLELKVLHPSRNEYLFTAREQGKGKESLPAMLDKLSEATRVALRENQAEIRKASAAVADRTTANFEAYQHYFKGEQWVARATSNTDIKAVLAARAEFQRAAALDPTFALAHWRIAWTQQWVHEDGSQALAQAIRYQDRAPEKERLYIRAFDAQARHQMDEAVARYQQVVAQYPHEKEAHFFVGDVQFHRSHLEPAIAHFRQALEIDPNFALVYDHLIDALTKARQFDLAKRYARQYLDRVPGQASAHWFIRPLLIAEPLEQAERSLREARDAHPEQVDLVLAPIQVRALRGDLDGAELELRDLATSTRPQLRSGAQRSQAWLATYRGRYREALRLLDLLAEEQKARGEWEPFGITVINEMALVQVGWRDASRVESLAARLREAPQPSAIAELLLAFSRFRFGQDARFAELGTRYPLLERTTARFAKAQAALAQGRYAEARALLEADDDPYFNANAKVELTELAARHGDPDGVITTANALLGDARYLSAALPRWPLIQPRTLLLLGKAYEAKGERKLAMAQYQKLLALWKDADDDLLDLQEARARVAVLSRLGVLH